MLMPVTTRAKAAPADQSQRILARLFPQQGLPMGQVPQGVLSEWFARPKSPTGLPVYSPPPPAPRPNPMGTQGAAPAVQPAPTAPQPAPAPVSAPPPTSDMAGRMAAPTAAPQGFSQMAQTFQSNAAANDPYAGLSPEDRAKLYQYDRINYSGPDYKGRHEANQYLDSLYAQMLRDQANAPPIDYSGGAQIGQYYDRARSRQAAMDAAMGRSGGGVGAAGQASLYGQQGSAVADMVRQLLEQRRQEKMAQENWMRNLTAQVGHEGLQRNWKKQDSPSFFQNLLGTVGSIAGNLIPGIHLGGGGGQQSAEVNTQPMGSMDFGPQASQPSQDELAAMFQQFQQPDQLDPFGQYGSR